ncbi:putative F-box protein [Cardamine amara subsp. amara]|uniref:F-box protein n=1 Tax=Cardamine amara subsp. amara TaxID=228776 RepID=A0ABD1AE28_CARAN
MEGMELDPNPDDLKLSRIPAKFVLKSHQKRHVCNEEDDDDEKEGSESELDWLPLDLKMAILIRLPGKSLMNVKLVSKMYSSIIRSRGFIDSYYAMSSTQSRFVVALSNGIFNTIEQKLIFLFSFSHEEESSSLVPNFDMAIPSANFSFLSGSCDSLHGFLSVTSDYPHMLCNPITEQVIKLPMHTRYVGYDPIGDDHKALSVESRNRNQHLEHKVLTLGVQGWRHIQDTISPYSPVSSGVCINGFVYYGAYSPDRPMNPDYKGKLASIVRDPCGRFRSFDLWILEDLQKHEWSKQTCLFPPHLWDSVGDINLTFTGTNLAGEIIIAPKLLSHHVRPFYIFFYNVAKNYIRRVRLLGIADDPEFRRSYGFLDKGGCHVRIVPQHFESIAFFKDPL